MNLTNLTNKLELDLPDSSMQGCERLRSKFCAMINEDYRTNSFDLMIHIQYTLGNMTGPLVEGNRFNRPDKFSRHCLAESPRTEVGILGRHQQGGSPRTRCLQPQEPFSRGEQDCRGIITLREKGD